MGYRVSLLFFNKGGFGIKLPKKVDLPLEIKTKPSLSLSLAQSAGAVEYTDCISAEGVRLPNVCPDNDSKQFDGEALVMLELCGMQSTPSLSLLPGPLCPGVVTPDRVK